MLNYHIKFLSNKLIMNFMYVKIPYGSEKIKINIPNSTKIILPNRVQIKNEEKIIRNSLKNPIDSITIEEFINKSKNILIIINDATKPTPTNKILKNLYPYIKKHKDIKFLIACGTHKHPKNEELKNIFGEFYDIFEKNIFLHNSYDKKNLIFIGKTKYGTELFVNKMIIKAKNIIVIGSVEPHYFAGYTGGRKAFFPGVSSFKTIEMNHKFAINDKAISLNIVDNPVHNDLTDALRFLNKINIFSIQVTLTDDYKIYSAKCGDIIKSFNSLIKSANKIYCVPIKEKGNIVVTVAPYPMDINLYQSQHAIENGSLALENGGILILVSKCRKGIGNDAFLYLLSKVKNYEEIKKLLNENYNLGDHKSARILKIKSKARLFAVTDLDNKIMEKAKFTPFSDIQKAIDRAIELIELENKTPKIILLPYGNLTVPKIIKN